MSCGVSASNGSSAASIGPSGTSTLRRVPGLCLASDSARTRAHGSALVVAIEQAGTARRYAAGRIKGVDSIRFDDQGLVPCVMQDAGTGEVLTLAYMNEEALERTRATGEMHFWSRSRGE